jgi:hypothetical protein
MLTIAFVAAPGGAGTTGGISGTVVDQSTGSALSGVRVSVTSASQNAAVTTDSGGHFAFVSLAPDTYVVTVEVAGYAVSSTPGVTITADNRQTLTLTLHRALRTIGKVVSRSAADLVRPGTTADVYSINAGQQDAVSSLGGGGNLDTAYSAISSVAGAYVPPNQAGYGQAVHIRGGDSDQVGYEFDGIPVNRGFDNSPGGSLSSLGQLELQVYTGATPANAEAQGLAGFVNQVIRTGTYPGFSDVKFDLGSPTYYHGLDLETGGSNAARTFSYYVGLGGYNQDFRFIDQFNGASIANTFGQVLYGCPSPAPVSLPSCFTSGAPNVGQAGAPGFALGSPTWGVAEAADSVVSRASVVNLHFGVPHGDGLKDDIQLLYDNNQLYTQLFSSPQEFGAASIAAYGAPTYSDSWQYTGALGSIVTDPADFEKDVVPYYFPSSGARRAFDGLIPADVRDVQTNGQAIVKLQYQRNFSTNSYLRLYGYTYYSDFIATGPNSTFQPYTGYDYGDYEVDSHTRGVSATYANQISSRNLIEAQTSYTTSTSTRGYNFQMTGGADDFAVVVNPATVANPAAFNGVCYTVPTAGTKAAPTTCNTGALTATGAPVATFATLSGVGCAAYGFACASAGSAGPSLTGLTCGSGPCAYYVAENGAYGEFNHVKPAFSGASLTDTWKPNDRLTVTAGLRLDQYQYTGDDTNTSPARAFWYAAFNADTCYDPALLKFFDKTTLINATTQNPLAIGDPCAAAGAQYVAADMIDTPSQVFTYDVLQPRLGSTYSLGPNTVLRGSFGKYNEQPSAAYQQYDGYQQDLPESLTGFYSYGFNTPGHEVRPEISYNTDFSLEHRFTGTDLSFKLSPFYRQTKDQIQNFLLNVQASLISGLNVGSQTSRGIEFAVNKGSFVRDGFAAQLAFAYTNSYVKYGALPNGTTILSPINADISTYNAYTKSCAPGGAFAGKLQFGTPLCGGTSSGVAAAPCYTASGAADAACLTGSIANPYWNAPAQSLFDPNAQYVPYSSFPGTIGSGYNSFSYPYTATLIVNYKHAKFALTPNVQLQAGNRYGSPITTPGIDPAAGCTAAAGATAGDPRYPYGAAGGAPYNATTCLGQLAAIPDPYTHGFDGIGAFRAPAQIVGNVRLSYALSDRVSLVATFANVVNHCFGGQKTAFTYDLSPQVCSYTNLDSGFVAPVGNIYNKGDNVQTFLQYPYEPSFGSYNDVTGTSLLQPFSAYLSLRVKL